MICFFQIRILIGPKLQKSKNYTDMPAKTEFTYHHWNGYNNNNTQSSLLFLISVSSPQVSPINASDSHRKTQINFAGSLLTGFHHLGWDLPDWNIQIIILCSALIQIVLWFLKFILDSVRLDFVLPEWWFYSVNRC